MMTLAQFVNKNKISADVEYADSNPNMEEDARFPMNHYRVTLRMGRKRMVVPFSQGMGCEREPDAKGVLNCLASDASGYDNARNFEDWCGEYGHDTDSRRAERTYKAVEKISERLKEFLGSDLYQTLLYKTEQL